MLNKEYKIFGETYKISYTPILNINLTGGGLYSFSEFEPFVAGVHDNFHDDTTIDLVRQGWNFNPSIPLLWMRIDERVHFIEGVYRIKKDDMTALIASRKGVGLADEENALNQITTDLGECYVVFQRHTTERTTDKTHNVMYHPHVTRALELGIKHTGYIDTSMGQGNDKYGHNSNNYTFRYKSILVPMNSCGIETEVTFTNKGGSYKKGQYIESNVVIHDDAYSSPGDFEFKIPSDGDNINKKHIILVHGYPNGGDNPPIPPEIGNNRTDKAVTCLFIMGFEHGDILPFFNREHMAKPEDQHFRGLINKILKYDGPEPPIPEPEEHNDEEEHTPGKPDTAEIPKEFTSGLIRRCNCGR